MSVRVPEPGYAAAQPDTMRYGDDDSGYGWILFAGLMLGMVATLNVIQGIAAIGKAHFYVANAHYVFGDLKTWGWIVLILGVCQGLAAVGIFVKNQFARWLGVAFAVLNAIAQLLFIPSYPFWSLSLFAIDVLIVYGLVAHGRRDYARA